jgi:hypothetical protein
MTVATQQPSIFRMFYTHKRTQILLEAKGIRVKNIEKVSINKPNGEFYCAVHVVYRVANGGRCSTFISCREYLQRATEKRKQEAENYKAYQDNDSPANWRVYPKGNPVKGQEPRQVEDNTTDKYRSVTTTPQAVTCDCEDFENQHTYLSQHPYLWQQVIKKYRICKHSLCALNHLGFSSLSKYLAAWQPGGRLNQLAVTMNRTRKSA